MEKRIGFIGLGIMGSSMARNLIRSRFHVTVFNRTTEKMELLVKEGASVAGSPAELANLVDIILLCVTNDEAVEEIVLGPKGIIETARADSVIVDHSTISPKKSKELAGLLAERGIGFVDAPVSGGDIGARNATLTIMVGGEERYVEQVLPVISLLGKKIVHVGPVGAGQMTKSVNQIVVALTVAAMTEGLFLAEHTGLNRETTLDVLRGGAAGSWSLDNYGPRVLKDELGPGFFAKDMLKDLRIALSEAEAANTVLPVAGLVKDLYQAMCRGDGKKLGNHGLIWLYEKLNSGD